MTDMAYPLLTCEAVLSEACFLLNRRHASQTNIIFEMINDGLLMIPFHATEHTDVLQVFMRKYADVPMSFADACLVRMAELQDDSAILMLDSDFRIYRKYGRQPLETIMPVE